MKLSLVVPCYNEEKNVSLFYEAVKNDFSAADYEYEIVFVNDGSGDGTFKELQKLCGGDLPVKIVNFSRNFGKESAMYAGLRESEGDYVTVIDADLQQRPSIALDMVKMLDVSKNVISRYTAEEVYDASLVWAKEYDEELTAMLADKEYALKVLGIERGNQKPRKDIAKWSDVKNTIYYMYSNKFDKNGEFEYQKITDKDEIDNIVKTYFEKYYNPADDKQAWFDKMKDLAEEMGYCREVKEYKANPENYKGHVGDISTLIRIAVTGRTNTPDLYEIMQVLGKDRVIERLKSFN